MSSPLCRLRGCRIPLKLSFGFTANRSVSTQYRPFCNTSASIKCIITPNSYDNSFSSNNSHVRYTSMRYMSCFSSNSSTSQSDSNDLVASLDKGCVQCRACRKDLSGQPDHPCSPTNQPPGLPGCKGCPAQLSPHRHLFCVHCGVIQPPNTLTYFQRIGLSLAFDMDQDGLDQAVKNLQRRVHPDRFCMKSRDEQEYSSEHSTQINLAHATLRDPLSRGRYILSLLAPHLLKEESATPTSMEMLMEVMEVRESIEDASASRDNKALLDLYRDNEDKKKQVIPLVSEAFAKSDFNSMASHLDTLAYWYSIEADLRQRIPNEVFEKFDIQPCKMS